MVTDPNVPPLPPHVDTKQLRSYLRALFRGDPHAREVIVATAREWWRSRSAERLAESQRASSTETEMPKYGNKAKEKVGAAMHVRKQISTFVAALEN